MNQHSDLNEAAEEPGTAASPGLDVGSVILFVSSLFLTGGLLVTVITTRAKFDRIFADFDTKLPMLTCFVQSAAFVGLVGLLFGLTGIKELLLKDATAKAIWNGMAILVALVLGELYVAGMFQPLIALMEKLS